MLKLASVLVLLFLWLPNAAAGDESDCSASGGLAFVCGLQNPEDLVVVPDTGWVLSSGMAPGGGIYLIDSSSKDWQQLYAETPKVAHDAKTFSSCQGAPDLQSFVSHGLHIRAGRNGHSTLYVVGHGGREAIEVFDVDASEVTPQLTWLGCVPMPVGLAANSVASLSDGSLVATVLMHPGQTFSDVFAGKPTGAVYKWSPGEKGFQLIPGTELPGNNGIEVSSDGKEIFVVSSGMRTISVFSNSNPSQLLRATHGLDFGPDNIHMTTDGQLMTAGPSNEDHQCGELDVENMDLEKFASCPRGYVAATYDVNTLEETQRWSGPANADFSNATMALQVGEEVWIGTFSGDRIGITQNAD